MDARYTTLVFRHHSAAAYCIRIPLRAIAALLIAATLGGCTTTPGWNWWRRADSAPQSTAPANSVNRSYPNGPAGSHYYQSQPGAEQSVDFETVADDEYIEPARIVATVADEVILAADVYGPINQALSQYADRMTPEQMDQQRALLLKQQLPSVIETKMLYVAYLRYLQKQSQGKGDIAQAMPRIWEKVHSKFDEEELPKLLKKHEVETAAQLDAKLREYGWSLAKQRRFYGERNLGMAAAYEQIRDISETTHEEMLAYYDQHRGDFEFPAQAKWEQLTVRFANFPTREAALRAIEQMGNEVALGGSPLWAVAKRSSQGYNANEGGQFDWTNRGSLASEPLDQAIFSLPINELSRIIEDNEGLHIVRVLDRRDAGRTPFTEAQVEIKKNIEDEKRREAFKEYMAELQRDIPVWTIYDRPGETVAGRPD